MVDVRALREQMEHHNLTVEDIAGKIGANRSTVYRKLKRPDSFTVGEVGKIAEMLQISAEDKERIFYATSVH